MRYDYWSSTVPKASKTPNLDEALATGRGVERSFCCDMHDDNNASASVNVIKGVWVCYACGARGRVSGSMSSDAVKLALASLKGDEKPRVLPEGWLDFFDISEPSPYWVSRVGWPVASRFRCGTHPYSGNPTYPLRTPAGAVLGVVERVGGRVKYLYPPGVSVSHLLFGVHEAERAGIRPRTVVVVEGAADVMALWSTRGMGNETVAVGCYGSGLHAPQIELIRRMAPTRVVLAFDNDDAGRRAASRRYELPCPVVKADWAPYKDAGEATPATRRKVMRSE